MDIAWHKANRSNRSNSNGGACVEVGDRTSHGVVLDVIHVRDTKDRDGGAIRVSRSNWLGFLGAVNAGEFDL